jgi:hypothetical protein
MTWVERGPAESFSILSSTSIENEVVQGNGECSGHILNRWHM